MLKVQKLYKFSKGYEILQRLFITTDDEINKNKNLYFNIWKKMVIPKYQLLWRLK